MPDPATSLPTTFLELLNPWMARQRWYAGKGRVPALRRIGGMRLADPGLANPAAAVDIEVHLILDESGQPPTTYQVPLTYRSSPLAGADGALVARVGTSYIYDAPYDPAFAAALLALMLDEEHAGTARGHRLAAPDPGRLVTSRVLTGEQSNTSIILDLVDAGGGASKPLICKLFRVLHHGENPDVVVQSTLAAAGSTLVPGPVGYVSGRWPDPAAPGGVAEGHLAFTQEFLPGVEDAWRVALAAVTAGADFADRAGSLGEATAQVHATLAQTMGTREATDDDIAALTASMRARHAAALAEVPALAAHESLVQASIEAVSSASWPALQRIHGDFHLGQVLHAPGRGWVLVDFEGEPLRPLVERTQPDLALRDVAGMLRSFDYVAGSWEQAHPGPPGSGMIDPQAWADRARTAFLDGYTAGAGRDPRDDAVLLNALELDKALYEVVYEARNRPTWLGIPTTAVARIARTAQLSAGRRSDLRS